MHWMQHLRDNIGYRGWRFDFAKVRGERKREREVFPGTAGWRQDCSSRLAEHGAKPAGTLYPGQNRCDSCNIRADLVLGAAADACMCAAGCRAMAAASSGST